MAGSPVSHAEMVVKILGKEYHIIASAIRERSTPITYEELFEQLTDHELSLQFNEISLQSNHLVTAAVFNIAINGALMTNGKPDQLRTS